VSPMAESVGNAVGDTAARGPEWRVRRRSRGELPDLLSGSEHVGVTLTREKLSAKYRRHRRVAERVVDAQCSAVDAVRTTIALPVQPVSFFEADSALALGPAAFGKLRDRHRLAGNLLRYLPFDEKGPRLLLADLDLDWTHVVRAGERGASDGDEQQDDSRRLQHARMLALAHPSQEAMPISPTVVFGWTMGCPPAAHGAAGYRSETHRDGSRGHHGTVPPPRPVFTEDVNDAGRVIYRVEPTPPQAELEAIPAGVPSFEPELGAQVDSLLSVSDVVTTVQEEGVTYLVVD